MQTGVVKWFNNAKGYGFILTDNDGKDVFAHYSTVEMDGYRTLKAGQCVAFEAIDGPKGLHAVSIKILADAPDVSSSEAQNTGVILDTEVEINLEEDVAV
jgi:CspA family cold shock protein